MRFPLLVVCTLLFTGLLIGCGITTEQVGLGSGANNREDHNIASFRENRMKLPVKKESKCLITLEKSHLQRNGGFVLEKFYDRKPPLAFRVEKIVFFDLDGNGVIEEFFLRDGKITVKADSHLLWQSQNNWWVDDFFIADTNNDGIFELNLLVWKEGSFGPQQPFWIKEDDAEVKNHFFIFKLKQGKMKPVWQSSNLDSPNYCADSFDYNGDGENELLVIEGSYTDPYKREIAIWKWNGWGFFRITLADVK